MCKVCIDGLYSAKTAALQHSSPFPGIHVGQGISILNQAGKLVKVPLLGPLCKAVTMMVIC